MGPIARLRWRLTAALRNVRLALCWRDGPCVLVIHRRSGDRRDGTRHAVGSMGVLGMKRRYTVGHGTGHPETRLLRLMGWRDRHRWNWLHVHRVRARIHGEGRLPGNTLRRRVSTGRLRRPLRLSPGGRWMRELTAVVSMSHVLVQGLALVDRNQSAVFVLYETGGAQRRLRQMSSRG